MYRVTCKQCGASGIAEDGSRLQQAVSCSCCSQAHDHDRAANACHGAGAAEHTQQHPGADCMHPAGGIACAVVTPIGDDCPGGHCFPGVDGCTVCRPLDAHWLGNIPLSFTGGNS